MPQAMKLSILIGADASGVKAGGAEAEQAFSRVKKAANDAGVSIQSLIDKQTGLSRAMSDTDMRAADVQAYGAQLDALRARYNPLFAVISRYRSEVDGIRQAHAVGAISSGEMAVAISRVRQATLGSIDAIKGRSAALAADRAATAAHASELNRLRAAFDPLIAAEQKHLAALSQIAEAEKLGAISASQAIDARLKETASYRAQVSVLNGVAAAKKQAAENVVSAQTITPDRGGDVAAYGAQLDALRSKYNPLFAVISRYKAEVADIREAQSVGAISTEEMTQAIDRQRRATLASIEAIKGRNSALGGGFSNDATFRRTNLGYQAFDVGQGFASGLPLPMILAQQGPQIAQAYIGQGGGLQAVKSDLSAVIGLAGSAATAIGPIGLAFGAVSAAAGAYYLLTRKETKTTDEVLQEHAANIKALGDAYGIAEDKLKSFSIAGAAVSEAVAAVSAADVRSKLAKELTQAQEQFGVFPKPGRAAGVSIDPNAFQATAAIAKPFADLFTQLHKDHDLERFAAGVKQIGDLDPSLKASADQILIAYKNAVLLNAELEKTAKVGQQIKGPGFLPSYLDRDTNLNSAFERQQQIAADRAQKAFDAQIAGIIARTPQQKANAARDAAAAQYNDAETPAVRSQRIELAGAQALIAAEHELRLAKDERLRSATASVVAAQNELAIAGQSVAVQARLRAEFQAEAAYRAAIAQSGASFNQAELDFLKQKAALAAQYNAQLAGQKALQQQNDDISRLQLEISLVGASADARAKSIAAYETEKQIRDQGIDSMSREADALRAGAQARAELQLQLERQQAAYQSLQQAEGSAIDTLVTGSGSLKDRLRSAADSALQYFEQIAVANPLKNMLTGTNLPTIGDFLTGKPASPLASTSTQAMTVTAGAVYINGAPIGAGLPFTGATATVPGIPAASNPLAGATATVSRLLPAANQNTPPTDVEAYIRQAALARGIDPNTALAVARSEGGLTSWNMQSRVPLPGGGLEPSFGPYQLYMNGGLGSQFQQQTGLDPRLAQNGPQGVDFALDYAKTHGWEAFHGAANSGISNWQGINPGVDTATSSMSKLSQTATATSTQIDKMGTGAIDASKALTDGNNSLVGSITKASQTAAQPAAPTAPAGVPAVGSGTAAGGGILSSITGAIGGMLKGVVGLFSSLFKGVGSIFGSLFGGLFAKGDVFSAGAVIPFANGTVIDKPTLFPMAGGRTGLMGEAGEEAIMPLRRGADGKLGVVSAMPRQTREGGAVHFNFTSSIKAEVHGNGDAELHAQMEAISKRHSEDTVRQIRNGFPSMVEDYQRNPNVRRYG